MVVKVTSTGFLSGERTLVSYGTSPADTRTVPVSGLARGSPNKYELLPLLSGKLQ